MPCGSLHTLKQTFDVELGVDFPQRVGALIAVDKQRHVGLSCEPLKFKLLVQFYVTYVKV